jgi:hypothetical protein
MHGPLAPFWPNSNRQTACFPMSVIFIFATAHYPSAALSELRVAIRLCDGRGSVCAPQSLEGATSAAYRVDASILPPVQELN